MLSCDTFALTKKYFRENENCLAKNSDRPLGEAQPLSFFPGGEHEEGEMLTCTHLTIPQAKKTYTVLGSRPYWIWGFEMGVNEMGLMIGNEAQGSRCEEETEEGLLGMDLLRLALERTATAREGVLLIGKLLQQYGQNANASQLFDRRYENSFLLIDRESIWLMETAGRNWAAREIHDWAAISNCYSIGTDYDLCSDDMEEFVRGKRWLRPQEPIDFAKAFTQPAVRQERSIPRWRRMQKLIAAQAGPLDFGAVSAVLRDHHCLYYWSNFASLWAGDCLGVVLGGAVYSWYSSFCESITNVGSIYRECIYCDLAAVLLYFAVRIFAQQGKTTGCSGLLCCYRVVHCIAGILAGTFDG